MIFIKNLGIICGSILAFITLISTLVYSISRYIYRPYANADAKSILSHGEIYITHVLNNHQDSVNYYKLFWQTKLALQLEYVNIPYENRNNENFSDFYDKIIEKNGEPIKRNFEGKLIKFISYYLKAKEGNVYSFYFKDYNKFNL